MQTASAGGSLIVTRDSRSFWAENVVANGDAVTFIDNETKTSASLTAQEVEIVLPCVERGRKYTEDEARATIKQITSTRVLHGKLIKQLKSMQSEWEAIITFSPDAIEKRIEEEITRFKSGPKDKCAYREIMFSLGMLRYRDSTGSCSNKFDNATDRIQEAQMGTSVRAIEAKANLSSISLEANKEIRAAVIEALKKATDDDVRHRLSMARTKARIKTLEAGGAEARRFIAVQKTIDNYIKSRTHLLKLMNEVVETKEETAALEKAMNDITQIVKTSRPDCDFSNSGFPMTKNDVEKLAANKLLCSAPRENVESSIEELCFMIVAAAAVPPTLKERLVVPVSILFNRVPPAADRVFIILAAGKNGKQARLMQRIPAVRIKDGRIDTAIRADLPSLGSDASPFSDANGEYLLCYVAVREGGGQGGEAKLRPICQPCRLVVKAVEAAKPAEQGK